MANKNHPDQSKPLRSRIHSATDPWQVIFVVGWQRTCYVGGERKGGVWRIKERKQKERIDFDWCYNPITSFLTSPFAFLSSDLCQLYNCHRSEETIGLSPEYARSNSLTWLTSVARQGTGWGCFALI